MNAKKVGWFSILVTFLGIFTACGTDLEGDKRSIEPTQTSSTVQEVEFTTKDLPEQTAEVSVTDGTEAEELYLSLLNGFGVYVPANAKGESLYAGNGACEALSSGADYYTVLEAGASAQDLYDMDDIENLIYAAVMALCPENLDRLP